MKNLPRKIFILSISILIISFVLLSYVLFDQPLGSLFLDKDAGMKLSAFIVICSFVVVIITTCMGGSESQKDVAKI